jgi:mannose-6-phosphate isomerase-like protein (cupin superfamily)
MSKPAVVGPRVLGPAQGLILGPPEATDRFIVDSVETTGRLAIVEHTIAPGVLAAPMHRHEREDEYSFVLEGRVGAIFDGVEVYATAGDFVRKPRGEWHTFWNAGDGPLRILEIITPGGLEELFRLMGAPDAPPDLLEGVEDSYGCAADESETATLIQRHGLRFSGDSQ